MNRDRFYASKSYIRDSCAETRINERKSFNSANNALESSRSISGTYSNCDPISPFDKKLSSRLSLLSLKRKTVIRIPSPFYQRDLFSRAFIRVNRNVWWNGKANGAIAISEWHHRRVSRPFLIDAPVFGARVSRRRRHTVDTQRGSHADYVPRGKSCVTTTIIRHRSVHRSKASAVPGRACFRDVGGPAARDNATPLTDFSSNVARARTGTPTVCSRKKKSISSFRTPAGLCNDWCTPLRSSFSKVESVLRSSPRRDRPTPLCNLCIGSSILLNFSFALDRRLSALSRIPFGILCFFIHFLFFF